MKQIIAILVLLMCVLCAPREGAAQNEWESLSVKELQQQAPQLHPAALYVLAARLFKQGEKDEAVFWFYCGQLRYRFHLRASPNLTPSGDPALFASLSEVVGRPINEYAFGDIPRLAEIIDKVLAWDESTPNATTSKTDHSAAWREIRDGLLGMKKDMQASKDKIKKQREQNRLPNRA